MSRSILKKVCVLSFLFIQSFAVSVVRAEDRPAVSPIDPKAIQACQAVTAGVKKLKALVLRGVDGDTVKVKFENGFESSIRMLTIDTPETHYQGQTQGKWGDLAAVSLVNMIKPGMIVDIVLDNESCDHYGRVLGYVEYQGADANLEQIKRGMAFPYCIAPNWSRCMPYAIEAEKARQARRGVWSDPSLLIPYEWRRIQSNRPHEKYVGDLVTHAVLQPGSLDKILVTKRIFFMKKHDIAAPFQLVQP